MSDVEIADRIASACSSTLDSVNPGLVREMVDGILRSRKVFIYGSGRSGLVGQLFAVRLVQLGLDVHFVGEMTTPIIGKEDLTLLISNTGRTSSVVQTARIARRIGSSVFCITGASGSPLTEVSDRSIVMDVSDGTEIRSIAPLGTVFEDSVLLLFDGIVADIMSRERITEEDMRNRHAIWVRSSFRHERRGRDDSVWTRPIDGHLADIWIHYQNDSFSEDLADRLNHLFARIRALGNEEHADIRRSGAYYRPVLAFRIGLDATRQSARLRTLVYRR